MPWNPQQPLADQRASFLALLASKTCSFTEACRRSGISRKTGYKWRQRATAAQPQPLRDRSRRPHTSPGRTAADQEQAILEVRDRYLWGARKIHAYLAGNQDVPSVRTIHAVLRRHGRVAGQPATPPQRFEWSVPNQLWQLDFKGPLPIAGRDRYVLTIEDDHSRYLLALRLCTDQTMATAWRVLWTLFGEVGLPQALLSDNGFGPRGPSTGGLSWLEARLVRLGIDSLHGRPRHPQTQGKAERLHRTLNDELWPLLDWRLDDEALAQELERWRQQVYNKVRPHEALGQQPPASRWYPSERPRPAVLPAVHYPAEMETRKVMQRGEVSWRGFELRVGAGLQGERVGIRVEGSEVVLLYATLPLRRLKIDQLEKGRIL